jgi:hypothetical protein
VLNGFGEIDATKIAVSVIDMLNHGSDAAFANLYFSDVIPLYILYLKWCMKMLNHNYSYLPVVMNYTNAVVGTLTVIPAYFLIRNLFRSSAVAFCTVLAFIFAPSIYQATIMGFPHLIAFFFLLLDQKQKSTVYLLMFLSCVFLTVAFLFKSDYVLATGAYFGFLYMRKAKDKVQITGAFLIILFSGILFLLFRNLILGPSMGTTMSKEGLSHWYNYSIEIPGTISFFITKAEPIAYGAGLVTFFLGIISIVYFLLKRKIDVLIFIVSWAAVPTVFWLVLIGNNARHNMVSVLPLLVVIIIFLYEKTPRLLIALTGILILGNYVITAPSSSILRPSGNLLKSHSLIEDRMKIFHSRAKEIADMDENKIAVLGYFHNPHVVFEIMRSASAYEAVKIGREDYKLTIGDKEYVFVYFVVVEPEHMEEGIDYILPEYHLHDHVFVSATYNLNPLEKRGLKTRSLNIIKSAL